MPPSVLHPSVWPTRLLRKALLVLSAPPSLQLLLATRFCSSGGPEMTRFVGQAALGRHPGRARRLGKVFRPNSTRALVRKSNAHFPSPPSSTERSRNGAPSARPPYFRHERISPKTPSEGPGGAVGLPTSGRYPPTWTRHNLGATSSAGVPSPPWPEPRMFLGRLAISKQRPTC